MSRSDLGLPARVRWPAIGSSIPAILRASRPCPGSAALRNLPNAARAAAIFVLAATLAACSRQDSRPDVLLVTIDTLRSDHCSAYGYPLATTPNLDRLAAGGRLYRRAYAESSTTAPSHAVLMTGRHFRTLGTDKNGAAVPEDAVTLAEALRGAGYNTAAFVSSFPLLERFGFSQGFEAYDADFRIENASIGRRQQGKTSHDRLAGATLARAREWIAKQNGSRPLFLWMHFVDPHAPYNAPDTFQGKWLPGTRRPIKAYDSEVHYADARLGELLELMKAYTPERETLVVVTSDHGEGLGDHGWMYHGVNLHEEVVRVPLVASWPGHFEAGKIVEEPVGLVDVAPAILDAVGVSAPTFSHGVNMFEGAPPSRRIFLQRRMYKSSHEGDHKINGEMTAVVEDGRKLIFAADEKRRELYDLGSDPGELHELLRYEDGVASSAPAASAGVGPNEAKAQRLEQALAEWKEEFPAAATEEKPMDKETLKALRALGYVD